MFKKIPGFSKYVISRDGEIRCVIGNKVVPTHRSNGYVFTHIVSDEGQRLSVGLHRCLALAYIECPGDPKKLIVNHIDNVRDNNDVKNLEWATRSRNQKHAVEVGTGAAIPTTVVNLLTGQECKFPSKRHAFREYSIPYNQTLMTKDFVFGHLKFIFQTENLGYEKFAEQLRGILVRNIFTGKVTIIDTLTHASRFTGIEAKVIKRILKGSRFTFPINGFDIRSLTSNVVWPTYSESELTAFKDLYFVHNPIWVTSQDGSEKLFGSVLNAQAFTGTYERTIRECTKTGKPCTRGFRYRKHNRKSIQNV